MPPRLTGLLDPAIARMLDICLHRAQQTAAMPEDSADRADIRARLALALIEATGRGARDEGELVEFALRVLPAYRERHVGG
ncbi:hypothetical protein [Ancylobacter oerskovii]|uniref:Uncharacterized protein n=1 Tax=Ancylobacter oerskovii TaxID=459519 RepID=A0ABW4YZF8_9HYPH|nr:hypothetical protein [Ancylobacter oerskovii]MBS7543943.1 hypothetical protein [Ancylobacter oerskovii]